MIKVMWFLKKADHLSLEEFRRWWLDEHVPDICEDQQPFLKKYIVDVRVEDDSQLAGRPGDDPFGWDGIAEQYFETIDDYNAVYARTDRKTRKDTLAFTKAFQRLVVREYPIDVASGQVLTD
jgi:hypothetical protein